MQPATSISPPDINWSNSNAGLRIVAFGPVDDIIQRVMACRTLAGEPSDSSNLPLISVPGDEQILSHDGFGKTGKD